MAIRQRSLFPATHAGARPRGATVMPPRSEHRSKRCASFAEPDVAEAPRNLRTAIAPERQWIEAGGLNLLTAAGSNLSRASNLRDSGTHPCPTVPRNVPVGGRGLPGLRSPERLWTCRKRQATGTTNACRSHSRNVSNWLSRCSNQMPVLFWHASLLICSEATWTDH